MFYGVINESYDKCDRLEIELENSLLFFKSLDIVQESGIQIMQESFSDIVERVKELWKKFKEWLSGIIAKVKGIFNKDKDIAKKIKETNDKIQRIEVKKEEPKNEEPKAEEPKVEEPKEIKWYSRRRDASRELIYITVEVNGILDYFKNHEMNENTVNYFDDACKKLIFKINNTNPNNLFNENSFLNNITAEQAKTLANEITYASDLLSKESEATTEEIIAINKIIPKYENDINHVTINDDNTVSFTDGNRISLNSYKQTVHNFVMVLTAKAKFLSKYEDYLIKYLKANCDALGELYKLY